MTEYQLYTHWRLGPLVPVQMDCERDEGVDAAAIRRVIQNGESCR
jgi:hypothetical protein